MSDRHVSYEAAPVPGVPSRFEHEMSGERGRMLRTRFLWYVGLSIALLLPQLLFLATPEVGSRWLIGLSWVVTMSLCVAAFIHAYRSPPRKETIVRLSVWLFILTSLLSMFANRLNLLMQFEGPDTVSLAAPAPPDPSGSGSESPADSFNRGFREGVALAEAARDGADVEVVRGAAEIDEADGTGEDLDAG